MVGPPYKDDKELPVSKVLGDLARREMASFDLKTITGRIVKGRGREF